MAPQDYGAQFRRGFVKQISSASLVVRCTTQHTSLLTVTIHLAGEEVVAVVHTGASGSVVEKGLVCKLDIWQRAKKVEVRQMDARLSVGSFIVNTWF